MDQEKKSRLSKKFKKMKDTYKVSDADFIILTNILFHLTLLDENSLKFLVACIEEIDKEGGYNG